MASVVQIQTLRSFYLAAKAAGHIYPQAAACEACVETTWGTSKLCVQALNLFGMKQHAHPTYGTINMPTKEFLHNAWVVQNDDFVKYPDLASCFKDRMGTLTTLAPHYAHYAAALVSKTPEEYLTQVSITWSTGPTRGQSCIDILHAHPEAFHG